MDIVKGLRDCENDPMWDAHAEVPKALCKAAADEIERLRACLAEIRIYAEHGLGKGITKSAILRAVTAGLHETP